MDNLIHINDDRNRCRYLDTKNLQCYITGLPCGLVYSSSFAIYEFNLRNKWEKCPAYNVAQSLAQKLIKERIKQQQSDLERKIKSQPKRQM